MGKSLLILGAGGHGKVVKEVALAMKNASEKVYDRVDFLDDNSGEAIGRISEAVLYKNQYDEAFCGIGNNQFRKNILEKLAVLGYKIPVLIHPTAYVSNTAIIEKGTVVEPKAIVNANTTVGSGSIISVGAIVDHNVIIGDYCHINAGAICKAGSKLEACIKLEAGEVVKGY